MTTRVGLESQSCDYDHGQKQRFNPFGHAVDHIRYQPYLQQ